MKLQKQKTIVAVLVLLLLNACSEVLPPEPYGPVPTQRQLAWHELEYYAFIHFNMNTFTDYEWGQGTEDPDLFNPTELDCRQWARVCKEAGMKGIIITAKHHDGFCLWPSELTDHSVESSSWQSGEGDVLKDLSEACREYGLKFGIYMSPWDRHESSYGDSPRYNEHFKNQLREVLTNYGDVFEVWFDGACGEGPNGKKQVYDWKGFIEVVRECQLNAVIFSDAGPDIRWVGTERGFANPTNWSTLNRDSVYPGYPGYVELRSGHEDGTHWVPAEADVSIRPGWYYHKDQDDKVKSLEHLLKIYFETVGRNANLLLNLPVDRRGLVHENDVKQLKILKEALDKDFALNLAKGKKVTADQFRGKSSKFGPENTIDENKNTYWATENNVIQASLTIDLGETAEFNCVLLQEYITLGQRIKLFNIEAWNGNDWNVISEGTTIGYKRVLRFPLVKTNKFRLNILEAKACPTISNVELYKTREYFK